MSPDDLYITPHAVSRFQERIRPGLSVEVAEAEIRCCLRAAKEKHLKAKYLRRNSAHVKTGCFWAIVSHCTVVTIVAELSK